KKVVEIDHDGKSVIQIASNDSLDNALELEIKKNEEQSKIRDEYSRYSLWVSQTFLKKSGENKTYEYWKECLEYSKNVDTSKLTFIVSFPIGTLAALGLDFFSEKLNDEEFEFCVHTILEIAQKLHEPKKRERYDVEDLDFSLSIYDNDSVY